MDNDDDGEKSYEVLRGALRISHQTWSKLEADSHSISQEEIVNEYMCLCPYVVLADRCDKKDRSKKLANNDDEHELRRTAFRLSQKAWSKLETMAASSNEAELLKEYIRLCPYISPSSAVATAALKGIEQVKVDGDGDDEEDQEGDLPNICCTPPPPSTFSPVLESTSKETTNKRTATAPSKYYSRITYTALRILFLDLPLLFVLLTYASLHWVQHVSDQYLLPQLENLYWTGTRYDEEITYYRRPCSADDLSTTNGAADLFLPLNATADDAYEHQLRHGFTVFPQVLSKSTADSLRKYIVSRNSKLSAQERIFVIAGKHRYSFGLGTEEASVRQAVTELARNGRLHAALEHILGPNPALIELTAITASCGAEAQHWHDDVIPTASAMNFARTFAPSYSVFVQLQDTSPQMGATAACPGTLYCSANDIGALCDQKGFQVVAGPEADAFWATGDALLMNMNSWHRGAAHTDCNALDRVMLILTFVPKPMERAETRQMSQGITFSLRWDMWGHTLDDLANAETAMRQPWVTLRALGLYKPQNAEWGIDYVTGASMRMANGDNGFRDDELEAFLESGGFRWLPAFLQAKVNFANDEGWPEFLYRTLMLCKIFVWEICLASLAVYTSLFLFNAFLPGNKRRMNTVSNALMRMLIIAGIAFLCFKAAEQHVDRTGWAADIKSRLRYGSTTLEETIAAIYEDGMDGPSTFPTKHDVLVETRYGSRQLYMYNDFINGHPGNRFFRNLVKNAAPTFRHHPFDLQHATAEYIIDEVSGEYGRFLKQAADGAWFLMDKEMVIDFTKRELILSSSWLLSKLVQEIRFMISDHKYGVTRLTAMSRYHSIPQLKDIEEKIMTNMSESKLALKTSPPLIEYPKTREKVHQRPSKAQFRSLPKHKTFEKHTLLPIRVLPKARDPVEPYDGAWLAEGDTAEALIDGMWYPAAITFVSAHGDYTIRIFSDGTAVSVQSTFIRRFVSYNEGEEVEVYHDGDYVSCRIEKKLPDETYSASCSIDEENWDFLKDLSLSDFRRHNQDYIEHVEYKSAYYT